MNLELLEEFYIEHKLLIVILIEKIIQSKRTSFQQSDEEIVRLEKKKILIFRDHEYSIDFNTNVIYSISKFFFEKHNLQIPNDFSEVLEYSEIVERHLRDNSFILGLHELEDEINAFWFVYLNNVKGLDLEDFVKIKIKNEIHNPIFELCRLIGKTAAKLILDKKKLYRIVEIILEKSKNPYQDCHYLFQGIRKFCKEKEDAQAFWQFAVENGTEKFEGILTYGFLGLYERDSENSFENLLGLFKNRKWLYSAIHTVCFTNIFSINHLNILFEIIYVLEINEGKSFKQIIFFFSRIVEDQQLEEKNINLASLKLLELSKSESPEIQCIVLNNIEFLGNIDRLKYEIMDNVNIENNNVLSFIKSTAYSFKNLDFFFRILRKCIVNLKSEFKTNEFQHSIRNALHQDSLNFERGIIKLLIDDLGIVRYAANRIIMQNSVSLNINLENYTEIQQQKMIEALFLHHTDHKLLISLLLQFRNTSYPSVMKLFLTQLNLLIFDYSGSAAEELKKGLDDEKDKTLLDFIEQHKTALYNYIDAKSLIKEFSPQLSMAKMFTDFYSKFNEQSGESMMKAEETSDSFFNHIPKVMVTRGSGFKISGGNTGVSDMHTISVGFTLPRSYFIAPEKTDWSLIKSINSNYINSQIDKDE